MTPRGVVRARQTEGRGAIGTIVLALIFVAWTTEWPISVDSATFYGQWRSVLGVLGPLFLPLPGISLTTWQIAVIVLAPLCMGAAARKWHAPEMDRGIGVALLTIAVTCLWGVLKGGSLYFAYYQVWRVMLGLMIGYMLMSVLRTEDDLILLGRMVVYAALMRAAACIYYYVTYLQGVDIDGPHREYVSSHDDSLIFVAAIQVTILWASLKGGKAAWIKAILVVAFVMYAIILNERRIAWLELVFGVPLLYALIGPGEVRRKINRWAMFLVPVAIAYYVAGLNSQSPIFAPVRAFSSAGSDADASSLARLEEIRNLLRTLDETGNPIMGTGWGRPYLMIERAYNNYDESWILAPYTPHNSLLGLAVYSGFVGLLGIWGVIPIAAMLAARAYRNAANNTVVRVASMAAIGTLCTYGVHCYGDIGLQSFPGAVLLGVALGVSGRLATWTTPEAAADAGTHLVTPVQRMKSAPLRGGHIKPSAGRLSR